MLARDRIAVAPVDFPSIPEIVVVIAVYQVGLDALLAHQLEDFLENRVAVDHVRLFVHAGAQVQFDLVLLQLAVGILEQLDRARDALVERLLQALQRAGQALEHACGGKIAIGIQVCGIDLHRLLAVRQRRLLQFRCQQQVLGARDVLQSQRVGDAAKLFEAGRMLQHLLFDLHAGR